MNNPAPPTGHNPAADRRTSPSSFRGSGLPEFFRYHGVWAPGVRLFRAIGFKSKALIISLAFALPMLFVSAQYFKTQADTIDFSVQERVGVIYLREAMPVLNAAQRLRRLSMLEAVSGNVPPNLAEERAKADEALKKLAAVEAAHGATLGTQKAHAALLEKWRALPSPSVGMNKVFEGYSEAVGKAMELISAATDGSNLTLDPDLDTYYLMDASMVVVPAQIEAVSRLRGLTLAVLAGMPMTRTLTKDIDAQALMSDWMEERIQIAQGKIRSKHPEFIDAMGIDAAMSAVQNFQALANSGGDSDQINAAGQQALDSLFEVQQKLTDKLDLLLQARVARMETARNLTASVLVLGMLLALYLFISFRQVLHGGLREVAHHIDAMREGNLTTTPRAWGADEVASLVSSLSAMQASLRHIVGQVRNASDSIVHASSEISSASADLSQRTEQSAANLEQTTGAMEKIAATVRHNEETVGEATRLAEGNASSAEQGGKIIGQVVQTMHDINSSSKRIGDIIGTIDGIAFQTNILALNAAVEAARAGEQGRGFAVVASEVRALAQRSAAAAREIKNLITASLEQVGQGTRVVHEAGETIEQIVGSSCRVRDLLAEVAIGARQQTAGIAQSAQAMQALDVVTQQNAALVEQTAAAAGSLNDQAQELAAEVAAFRLPA